MIYLTTGANGAGKTLCTLQDVREQQLKENRPVYFHGFEMDPEVQKAFGWIHWDDPTKWMEIPEGSICLFDECQAYFGKTSAREAPDYILDLAKYRRKRGIDMWLITPHPSMLHVDVRRLIESPSWHRHVKRAFGADMVSVTTYSVPNLRAEEGSTDDKGAMTMRAFPKEVYKWYRSASLHTGKRKVPRSVWILLGAVCLIPVLAYFAWGTITSIGDGDKIAKQVLGQPAPGAAGAQSNQARQVEPQSPQQYAEARTPRFEGLPQTAPVYDSLTVPVVAPYPAACVSSKARCTCYTQQGTRLATDRETCLQIVERGYFVDWAQPQQAASIDRQDRRPPTPALMSGTPDMSRRANPDRLEAAPATPVRVAAAGGAR